MTPIFRLATLTATAFLTAAAASACSEEATTPTDSVPTNSNPGIIAGTLEAVAARPTLILKNGTEFEVGFMVVDKDQMVVALYPPCGDNCPKLVQGAELRIPYSAINGYTNASTEAVVMWWPYTRQADGSYKATGAVQTKNIRL